MSIKYTSHKAECDAAVDAAIARALEICGGTAERHTVDNLISNGSVQSGVLMGSITHQKRDKYTMAVGTRVKYAPYVELGHHQQPGAVRSGNREAAGGIVCERKTVPAPSGGEPPERI